MTSEKQSRALIVGLGIAGMSTAIRLKEAGWEPVLVERAPARRTGGYMVGMFPEGIAAAERLGVNASIVKRTLPDGISTHVDETGGRFPGPAFTDQPGSPQTVLRGDIEAGLWEHLDGQVEVRFDTSPVAIDETAGAVTVTLRTGATGEEHREEFDLVVGADGLRSTVRRLAFGPDETYLKSMDAMICAFQMSGQLPGLTDKESAIVAEPRRAMWIFAMADTEPTVLFTYRTRDIDAQFTRPATEVLRDVFGDVDADGLVDAALAELETAPAKLFDSVQQVRMPAWHTDRVVLVGDAAWCLTLYSGMGATAGILGGTALGDALADNPDDLTAALRAYEKQLRPFTNKHQRLARLKSELFVPSSEATSWIRWQLLTKIGLRPGGRRANATA